MKEAKNVIPFGKHKGKLVEEVLATDPSYLHWLCGQADFRVKFGDLYQVIINRGAEPEETPDHNAMQVKFLDAKFCIRFVEHAYPDCFELAAKLFDETRKRNLNRFTEIGQHFVNQRKAAITTIAEDQESWRYREAVEKRDEADRVLEILTPLKTIVWAPPILPSSYRIGVGQRAFESRGIDVVFEAAVWGDDESVATKILDAMEQRKGGLEGWKTYIEWKRYVYHLTPLMIEIKPVVGDDYPAILRQMKRTGANILFVGTYSGVGATQDEFVATMATAGIRTVFSE
jgi:uncharacterized protein (DUF3820 family)